jgi:Fe-S-cluster containining protein
VGGKSKNPVTRVLAWWRGRKFECTTCGACCRFYTDGIVYGVKVSSADATRLPPELLVLCADDVTRLVANGFQCAALERGADGIVSCRVYTDRPQVCRSFTKGSVACVCCRKRYSVGAYDAPPKRSKWLHIGRLFSTMVDGVTSWWRGRYLDCTKCGACCKMYHACGVPVFPDDLHAIHPKYRTQDADGFHVMATLGDKCAALAVNQDGTACKIYKDRPRSCREFKAGSADCLHCRATFKITQ